MPRAGSGGRSWRSGCAFARPSHGELAWRVEPMVAEDFLQDPQVREWLDGGRRGANRGHFRQNGRLKWSSRSELDLAIESGRDRMVRIHVREFLVRMHFATRT